MSSRSRSRCGFWCRGEGELRIGPRASFGRVMRADPPDMPQHLGVADWADVGGLGGFFTRPRMREENERSGRAFKYLVENAGVTSATSAAVLTKRALLNPRKTLRAPRLRGSSFFSPVSFLFRRFPIQDDRQELGDYAFKRPRLSGCQQGISRRRRGISRHLVSSKG